MSVFYKGKEFTVNEEKKDLILDNIYLSDLKDIEGLSKLKNVKMLSLRSNKLTNLKGLKELNKLEELILEDNPIENFKSLEKMKSLKHIFLDLDQLENYVVLCDEVLYDENKNINLDAKINFLKKVDVFNYDINGIITSCISHLEWVKDHRVLIARYNYFGEELKFNRFNIFIGKNNSGKTFMLNWLYKEDLHNLKFDKKPNTYETYYIPKLRILDYFEGELFSLQDYLMVFLENMISMQHYEPITLQEVGKEKAFYRSQFSLEYWRFPYLIEMIDLISHDFAKDRRTHQRDLDFLKTKNGMYLIEIFRKVHENWKKTLRLLFQDIEVAEVNEDFRTISLIIKDTIQNIEYNDWKLLGSGFQELISLVFFIEFLKIAPYMDYKSIIQNMHADSYKEAFDVNLNWIIPNRVIFIDEPENSLHPSLKKIFFNYLHKASHYLQIFVATHSPDFLNIKNFKRYLNHNIAVILCLKDGIIKDKPFRKKQISINNLLLVVEELYEYNALQMAFYISKNDYEYLKLANFTNNHISTGRFYEKRALFYNNIEGLLKLGTAYEEADHRLLQNSYFLSTSSEDVRLEIDFDNKCVLKKIFLCQLNDQESINVNEHKGKHDEILNFCKECWDKEILTRESVLVYNLEQTLNVCTTIKQFFNEIEQTKIPKKQSLIVFPENSIPYDALKILIKFAVKHQIVIVGGMEHIKISKINKKLFKLNEFELKHKNPYQYNALMKKNGINGDPYINQAVIINSDQFFTFQIKHIPVYLKESNIKEGIPVLREHKFRKIFTVIGIIGVFICKDYLVNHNVIDNWMSINKINTLIIPSFTELYYPFRNKLGEKISFKENEGKLFVFVNIAKYGGSGVYSYFLRRDYEYGKITLLGANKETWKPFDL